MIDITLEINMQLDQLGLLRPSLQCLATDPQFNGFSQNELRLLVAIRACDIGSRKTAALSAGDFLTVKALNLRNLVELENSAQGIPALVRISWKGEVVAEKAAAFARLVQAAPAHRGQPSSTVEPEPCSEDSEQVAIQLSINNSGV